ncbi:SPARC-related modular calcium-binding protein 2-like isoform X3 [Mizuhopecten yessoensis]|uniref:SPARC-related modular calcium-binding protein 2-like isoform X3 n=1 Tax=Mizuhopecten yessoensis TaxID=6573 RepID=UPI000B45D6D0|nr:SPARC-related modular calcium-binding protein 2-like isoform X3 [Mizuhopecten yessoensis]
MICCVCGPPSVSTMSLMLRCGFTTALWSLVIVSICQSVPAPDSGLSVSEIQETGKVLFRSLRNTECSIDCEGKGRRPVCGSDGVTYASRCDLKRAKQCENRRVKVKSKGVCSGLAAMPKTKCIQEREEAQVIARKPTLGIFIPECEQDGSYTEIQCHAATGYCWCVTNDGKPIKGTSISGKSAPCKRKSTRGKRRRPQKSEKHKRRTDRRRISPRRKKRACKSTDRIEFNQNLVAAFTQEYQRFETLGQPGGLPGNPLLSSTEKRVVDWKFSQLDRNNDNKLRRREVRSLKRMVKKVIKPRACARNFAKYCDLDQNKRIERKEWSICLGVDIKSNQSVTEIAKHGDTKEDQSPQLTPEPQTIEEPELIIDFPPRLNRWSTSGLNPRRTNTPAPPIDTEDTRRSCRDEQSAAMRPHEQDPDGGIFIPVCTDEGKWNRAQCHKSSQYCWCVDEKTGSPIPGTSTHKIQPPCVMESAREMKGCPLPKKRRFLNFLLEQLAQDMDIYVYNGTDPSKRPEYDPELTVQEKAAKWKFKCLDANANNMLERKELKQFRQEIPKRKDTRKCSRNFIRYCDADSNRKITLDEWIDCMGLKDNTSFLPQNPNRKGPNPFSHYLKPS